MSAPERIWVWPEPDDEVVDAIDDLGWAYGDWDRREPVDLFESTDFGCEQYVRADLFAALEAEKAKAEALLREAVEALEDIAKPRYGLQAVLEDGGSDDDIAHYYQSVCTQYHSCARATLARIKEAKDNG